MTILKFRAPRSSSTLSRPSMTPSAPYKSSVPPLLLAKIDRLVAIRPYFLHSLEQMTDNMLVKHERPANRMARRLDKPPLKVADEPSR